MQADDKEVESVEQAQRCTLRFATALRFEKHFEHKFMFGTVQAVEFQSFWVKKVCIFSVV